MYVLDEQEKVVGNENEALCVYQMCFIFRVFPHLVQTLRREQGALPHHPHFRSEEL